MIVSNHQIQNVLKVYSSRLIKGHTAASQSMSIRKPLSDAVDGAAQSKRQALIERFTEAIVRRIIGKNRWLRGTGPAVDSMESEIDAILQRQRELEFAYNVIEEDARKTLNTLSMANSKEFIERL